MPLCPSHSFVASSCLRRLLSPHILTTASESALTCSSSHSSRHRSLSPLRSSLAKPFLPSLTRPLSHPCHCLSLERIENSLDGRKTTSVCRDAPRAHQASVLFARLPNPLRGGTKATNSPMREVAVRGECDTADRIRRANVGLGRAGVEGRDEEGLEEEDDARGDWRK
jgi:hypothetical protein